MHMLFPYSPPTHFIGEEEPGEAEWLAQDHTMRGKELGLWLDSLNPKLVPFTHCKISLQMKELGHREVQGKRHDLHVHQQNHYETVLWSCEVPAGVLDPNSGINKSNQYLWWFPSDYATGQRGHCKAVQLKLGLDPVFKICHLFRDKLVLSKFTDRIWQHTVLTKYSLSPPTCPHSPEELRQKQRRSPQPAAPSREELAVQLPLLCFCEQVSPPWKQSQLRLSDIK